MSIYHKDKGTKPEIGALKNKVVSVLTNNEIDISKLEIRSLSCYGGDTRVYLGHLEQVNTKSSFRRNGSFRKEGNATLYEGTRGNHITKRRDYVVFNAEDFDNDQSMVEYNIYSIKKYLKTYQTK